MVALLVDIAVDSILGATVGATVGANVLVLGAVDALRDGVGVVVLIVPFVGTAMGDERATPTLLDDDASLLLSILLLCRSDA